MYRTKFCGKCGRPIKSAGYCEDCAQDMVFGTGDTRCTFCGKNKLASRLFTNIKTRKTYCSVCLQVFSKALKERGFEDQIINKILREDFVSEN